MEAQEQIRVLKDLLGQIDSGSTVDAGGVRRNPVSAYTCAELAMREWEYFFQKHPQIVGMSADLPQSGSFFTLNDFGTPLLATRDSSGRFRVFANVCSHRGALVENDRRGQKQRFSCPFHAWTYNAEGSLVAVPKSKQFGELNKDCLGLVEFPAMERFGLLWMHPGQQGMLDVDALLSGLDSDFRSWNFERRILTGENTFDTPMNWKLAVDTFGESYHFTSLHKDTLSRRFYGNVQSYQEFGRNHRLILCKRAIDELRDVPEQEWTIGHGASPVYYLFPNVQLTIYENDVILIRVYPKPGNPLESVTKLSFYADPDEFAAAPDEVQLRQQIFAHIIRDEDYATAAMSQIGASSGVRSDFIFGRNEPALHHFHNNFRDGLGLDPLPLSQQ